MIGKLAARAPSATSRAASAGSPGARTGSAGSTATRAAAGATAPRRYARSQEVMTASALWLADARHESKGRCVARPAGIHIGVSQPGGQRDIETVVDGQADLEGRIVCAVHRGTGVGDPQEHQAAGESDNRDHA